MSRLTDEQFAHAVEAAKRVVSGQVAHSTLEEHLAAALLQASKNSARYRYWRKHYNSHFVLSLPIGGLKFVPSRPVVEIAGLDYEDQVDAAIDSVMSEHPPDIAGHHEAKQP